MPDRIIIKEKPSLWRTWGAWVLFFLLGAGSVAGWQLIIGEKKLPVFWPRKFTPYEQYVNTLHKAGLDTMNLGNMWIHSGKQTLEDTNRVPLPFLESGFFPGDAPQARSWMLKGRAGEIFDVDLQITGDLPAQVFIDLFEVSDGSGRILTHVAAADSAQLGISYWIEDDGEYVLRIQPELLRNVFYSLTITRRPSFAFPVSGKGPEAVQSMFGAPRDGGKRKHKGIDIFAPKGTPVIAGTNGRVSGVREGGLGGKVVWLRDDHAPQTLYYAHLDKQLVVRGQRVQVGDTLGLVGKTGNARYTPPHLHFGVYRRNRGALDPFPYVKPTDTIPTKVTVPTNILGHFCRTKSDRVDLHASPDSKAPVVRSLAKDAPLRIWAATATWYRTLSTDGTTGYVSSRDIDLSGSPSGELLTTTPSPLWSAPTTEASLLTHITPASQVEIWGRVDSFVWVRTETCAWGWLSL